MNLDLSGNKIGDDGAMALAEALVDASISGKTSGNCEVVVKEVEKLDLSGNADVGDDGATAIALAFGKGKVQNVSLRSCSVQADGASAFGKAIVSLAQLKQKDCTEKDNDDLILPTYTLDLSGNLFGTVTVEKKKSGLNKHAQKLLNSKASAKVASQMTFLGRKLQSGLKEAGLDVSPLMDGFKPSAESDDDEEELMGMMEAENDAKAGTRCGARSFADPFVGFDLDGEEKSESKTNAFSKDGKEKIKLRCRVGMRHCYLDAGAADALAAAILRARDTWGIDLTIDTSMNRGMINEESMAALSGAWEMRGGGSNGCWRRNPVGETILKEMAERHLNALKQLAQARKKAADAAEAVATRARAEAAFGLAWEESNDDRDEYDNYDEYDADANFGSRWDYDDEVDQYDDNYDNFGGNY